MQDSVNWTGSPTHKWRQSGQFCIWRYTENTRNYPGWHLVLDSTARDSFISLLDLLRKSHKSVHRTIRLNQPTKAMLGVPNNRGGSANFKVPTKLSIHFDPAVENLWSLESVAGVLEWCLGSASLEELESALAHPNEYFDRQFGEDKPLWFWGIVNEK